ncbi:hypothetical protein A8F94_17535 [Bacillus sp. FJAT-27225]|uniref:hypothetical protein n=1 Tax=Bacillus sp. FJAT-27225 TaxID=1743144 RepID=UPI00080C2831|nr:hypothetical protein [Bacillus sp. FJAT-27225]OCA84496.1 hypothetical protein A8F94_17535 [Bacillus sp. FJAT-27225]
MRVADHLTSEQKQQLNRMAVPKNKGRPRESVKKPKKKQECVNWPEIMGMNRDTYRRVNGAVRRK